MIAALARLPRKPNRTPNEAFVNCFISRFNRGACGVIEHDCKVSRAAARRVLTNTPNIDTPTTVERVTEQPRNEFLPKPRWRTHAGSRQLGLAIGMTFASVLAFGVVLILLFIGLIRWLNAPPMVSVLLWVGLTIGTILWALVARSPATSSELEYQPWTEYVVRYVMVGNGTPRPLLLRFVTGVLFGAPVGCYFVVFFALALTGLV